VGTLLRCNGFEVTDIGVDVPAATFLAKTRELNPLVVGLSALLTTTFDTLRDTIALLRAELKSEDRFPTIIIGGGSVDETVLRHTGADHWAPDAASGLRLCEKILNSSRRNTQAAGS
jgi:methanogenic corrinoid protein MtbC1